MVAVNFTQPILSTLKTSKGSIVEKALAQKGKISTSVSGYHYGEGAKAKLITFAKDSKMANIGIDQALLITTKDKRKYLELLSNGKEVKSAYLSNSPDVAKAFSALIENLSTMARNGIKLT